MDPPANNILNILKTLKNVTPSKPIWSNIAFSLTCRTGENHENNPFRTSGGGADGALSGSNCSAA
jgi:hypothetical protein